MTFSKSFIDSLRSDISLADIIGSRVAWDSTKTQAHKGDFWAPCPFHEEKTASFHVDANKGFYYCFGCQAKGDCFTFLRDFENLSFSEAVHVIAQKLGVPIPAQTEDVRKREKSMETSLQVIKLASKFYRSNLQKPEAIAAKTYLQNRGISEKAIAKFEIGYALSTKNSLTNFMTTKGITLDQLVVAGLCSTSDSTGEPFDRFRNRIVFPIHDSRGRTIAFGGRSMNPKANAKYLNSPETSLFSKGKVLYNYFNAKSYSSSESPLIVVEGYIDVIALWQAGYQRAVAPLGTAITAEQLFMLWNASTEPVIALDGDTAGKNATKKLIGLALRHLEPEKSLRFAVLPAGQDPDDLIKSKNFTLLEALIENAYPLIDVLWNLKTENRIFDSPERKAALDASMRDEIRLIKNAHLRSYFLSRLAELQKSFFSVEKAKKLSGRKFFSRSLSSEYADQAVHPLQETKNSVLGKSSGELHLEVRQKEGAILMCALNHPNLAIEFEYELSRIEFVFNDLAAIRDAMLAELTSTDENFETLVEKLNERLKMDVRLLLGKIPHLDIHPDLNRTASIARAKRILQETILSHETLIGFNRELRVLESEILKSEAGDLSSRIQKLRSRFTSSSKKTYFQVGSEDDDKESIKVINSMIEDEIWIKKK
ncbi:MAG: DNA primase [Pseudomonadota bacterium]|nr:DNA primase [Pseudomonadota bacterium]